MPAGGQAIINEIEAAISAGSAAKCIETARRVTDLFLVSAGQFSGEQVDLFDNVLERLVKTIELRAISDMSARMALTTFSWSSVSRRMNAIPNTTAATITRRPPGP